MLMPKRDSDTAEHYNLSVEKVMALINVYKKPELKLLLRLLYYTGGRVSEPLGLRPRDIIWDSRILMLPALKDKQRRQRNERKRVVVDTETLELLRGFIQAQQIRKDEFVIFRGITNGSTRRWKAWEIVKKAGELIGEPWIHPHTLRHTFAVHWAEGGGDLLRLQRQLGHKRLSTTTDMYIRFKTADIQKDYDRIFQNGGQE